MKVLIVFMVAIFSATSLAYELNGFSLDKLNIERSQIFRGGPPKDGIPAIDQPTFIPAAKVDFLKPDDVVLAVTINGKSRAYPLRILVWHEIVNDQFQGQNLTITYCPLCGTAMVFDANIDGERHTFGVSGLLYQSDVLMYDRNSESLWSQLGLKAVSGDKVGQRLTWLPSQHLTWSAWQAKFPQGEVLSTQTGYSRNYASSAYQSYFNSPNVMFPVDYNRNELEAKAWVLGVIIDGQAKAYPLTELPKKAQLSDTFAGQSLELDLNASTQEFSLKVNNQPHPIVKVYWFAWQAFYPTTELYTK
ncbi:DUF3179 domain-containing protein [Vibrio sp. SCSIO 43136]|uniref:DUF3179 domain-containing protein n=1 Tax=Vibrio sp. SCSIO 43136 TaxID=2819101 RepID=UPI002075BDD5|nr:DUF3179 domain-containing protein [Vibrio sp. SCSIO 43136]USD67180.1 DUF3179 domain-containing protein [Vibrio sp. SCSIO 43136]